MLLYEILVTIIYEFHKKKLKYFFAKYVSHKFNKVSSFKLKDVLQQVQQQEFCF
jgi:hypothetical protein